MEMQHLRQLDRLQHDLLGDLAQDDHSLYEVFEFVRCHHPGLEDTQVFELGRALVAEWVANGWLDLSEDSKEWGHASSVSDLLSILDQHGNAATRYFEGSPKLRLGATAYADFDWLSPPQ